MGTPRVGKPLSQRRFGVAWQPNHVRHAGVLKDVMGGHGAELSRITGIPERMLQYYAEPQSRHPGPAEQLSKIVRGLRQIPRVTNPDAPAEVLCRDLGALFLRYDTDDVAGDAEPLAENIAATCERFAQLVAVTLRKCGDGQCTAEDLHEFERVWDALQRELHLTKRQVEAEAARCAEQQAKKTSEAMVAR